MAWTSKDELGTSVDQEGHSRQRHEQLCKEENHGMWVENTKDPFGWSIRLHPGQCEIG